MYPMTCALYWEGKGESWLKLLSPHCRRPYKTCSDVIRIVFSLLMSSSSGGLSRPPAVRLKAARTPWGRGLISSRTLIDIMSPVLNYFFRPPHTHTSESNIQKKGGGWDFHLPTTHRFTSGRRVGGRLSSGVGGCGFLWFNHLYLHSLYMDSVAVSLCLVPRLFGHTT